MHGKYIMASKADFTDDQINQVLNKLNGQNCYISADSNEKGVATSDESGSKSFISNIVILVVFIFIVLCAIFGFMPFYKMLITDKNKFMHLFWWVISGLISFFSLIIGILKNISHIFFFMIYSLVFFICLSQIIYQINTSDILGVFTSLRNVSNSNFWLFLAISIVIPIIFWIIALTQTKTYMVNIFGYLGYAIAIIGGIIATLFVK